MLDKKRRDETTVDCLELLRWTLNTLYEFLVRPIRPVVIHIVLVESSLLQCCLSLTEFGAFGPTTEIIATRTVETQLFLGIANIKLSLV